MAAFEDEVVTLINGSNGWVTGTNLFKGPIQPDGKASVPVVACFVRVASMPEMIDFENGNSEKRASVQVLIRHKPDLYDTGFTLAQNTLDGLHRNRPSGYFEARVLSPNPLWVGTDDRRNNLFSFDFRLTTYETS